MKTRFKLGDYNFICDTCGNKRKASTGKYSFVAGVKTFFNCPECWDRDHPANTPPRFPTNEGGPVKIPRPDVAAETVLTMLNEDGYGQILMDDDSGQILFE